MMLSSADRQQHSEESEERFETGDNRQPDCAFDREAALEQGAGDETFLSEIIGLFIDDASQRMIEIRHSVQLCDANRLERAAHALKGSAACLGAAPTSAAAARLEVIGKGGDLSDAAVALSQLEQELRRLDDALARDTSNKCSSVSPDSP
jgi:HPt (histidine-containing phosphotransfer) domain-containing protein